MNKQEFSASSWRSNQGYTKMHGQPTIKTDTHMLYCITRSSAMRLQQDGQNMQHAS